MNVLVALHQTINPVIHCNFSYFAYIPHVFSLCDDHYFLYVMYEERPLAQPQ